MILLNTNKQRWIIMILTIMITFACSKEEKDGISTLSDDTNGTASLTAVYEANWVVNQEVVGQCKYYVNGSRSYVDSYPSRYLFNWIDNYNKGLLGDSMAESLELAIKQAINETCDAIKKVISKPM